MLTAFQGGGFKVTPTSSAYETIPNQPTITGKMKGEDDSSVEHANPADPSVGASLTSPMPDPRPASPGTRAMGARELSIWRPKEWAFRGN